MKRDKFAEVKIGILFLSGVIFSVFTLGRIDALSVFVVILVFLICGYMIGKNEAHKKYENLHYTVLESDGRKRREKDKKLSKEIHEYVKNWEKENSNEK